MKFYTSLIVFMLIVVTACQNQEAATTNESVSQDVKKSSSPKQLYKVLSPADFTSKMEGDVQLIDVRRPEEFAAGHIEGAINYNFQGPDFNKEIAQLDKSKPVLLYCRSGRRSNAASKKLQSVGFTELYDLQGGYLNWVKTKAEE